VKSAKVYRLYIWKTSRTFGSKLTVRGRCIAEFNRYKDLLADGQRRAVAAGYPKSRWMDLFDWNV